MANETAEAETGSEFAAAHRDLVADESIQFAFSDFKPPEVPAWLKWLGEFLYEIFPLLKILFWAGVAAAVIAILYVVARRLSGSDWPWRRRRDDEPAPATDWRPEEAPARALLGEADALAARGRFSEAAHLLLFRSIEEIDARRPRLVRPALTSRDIAGEPAIPPGPRQAFASIVMTVERSLFGGRPLGEPDWRQCRAAYEEFAFAGAWR
ncbi:MAG TPA: DUF4129 domain-containing protein [Allosphingosinicella sp.]